MIDDLGGDTEDLLALRRAHPAEARIRPGDREGRVRRFGRINYIGGISLGVVLAMNSLIMAMMSEHGAFTDPDAELFAVLALVALITIAGALAVVGALERLNRPQRSATRQVLAQVAAMQEQIDVVMGTTTVLPGRLAGIERRLDEMTVAIKAVPDYGRGVVDGMQVRNEALGPERP